MATSHNRLWRRICHQSQLLHTAATPRFIVSQQHYVCTTPTLQPRRVSNTNLLSPSATLTSAFTTKAAASSSDDSDDSDSDFSDFSDFTDSDSDVEDFVPGKSQTKSSPNKTSSSPKKSDFQFDREDVSSEQLMKDRLIVSNLNFSTNRNDLWELCEAYGTVTDVHLPANKNREYHNRGFGFVTFEKDEEAARALDNL